MSQRPTRTRLCFFVTEDWYFVSHRLPLAIAAKDAGYDVSVITRVRDHGETIRRAGLRLIPFEMLRGGVNPVVELWTVIRLVRLCRRERPDIAHHVAIKPVIYGSIAARVAGTRRVVNAVAGMGWVFSDAGGVAQMLKLVVRAGLRWVLRRGTVIVQNPEDGQVLGTLGVAEDCIRRIPGAGVDLQTFIPRPEPDSGAPVIVLPARLLWSKGVGDFAAASLLLKEWQVEATCVLAGEPDKENPAAVPKSQIANWVAQGVLEHRGWVKDMPGLFASCHVVCLPTFYGEGIPKSLIEAAAAGRPIVATDMPGCREIVRHGENGLLVPPRDPNALARALATLARDRDLRVRMGASGRALAEREFGIQSVVKQTMRIYEALQ